MTRPLTPVFSFRCSVFIAETDRGFQRQTEKSNGEVRLAFLCLSLVTSVYLCDENRILKTEYLLLGQEDRAHLVTCLLEGGQDNAKRLDGL